MDIGVEGVGVDRGESSSMTMISGSEAAAECSERSEAPEEDSESLVRSITSSCTLSLAAFSASWRARAPEAQAFSSRALRSAACGEHMPESESE